MSFPITGYVTIHYTPPKRRCLPHTVNTPSVTYSYFFSFTQHLSLSHTLLKLLHSSHVRDIAVVSHG